MRLPAWIKTKYKHEDIHKMKRFLRRHGLSTVCEEAMCPNKSECFSKLTAAFMILGSCCTRNCGFCSVENSMPLPPDKDEPIKVALASMELELRYVVITSPARDDLPDGGALQFRDTAAELKRHLPDIRVEVLTPDFQGSENSLMTVLSSNPDVFNHNIETVPSLYPKVRPQADYRRSLKLLFDAKRIAPEIKTKSGLMVGLGETIDEVLGVLKDLRAVDCDFLTIGQYLMPSKKNLPVVEYLPQEKFEMLKDHALGLGFKYAQASPLVRSSMNAHEVYEYVNV